MALPELCSSVCYVAFGSDRWKTYPIKYKVIERIAVDALNGLTAAPTFYALLVIWQILVQIIQPFPP